MQTKVRCRGIREDDLDAVRDILCEGFPGRSRAYWSRGLEWLAARALPPGVPRFGYLIEHEGRLVGVILLIFTEIGSGPAMTLRCNVSSWYVDPNFRMHASMLIFFALKHRQATYINISPAPHTWATVEAQGFTRYTAGQIITVPALRLGARGVRIHRIDAATPPDRFAALPERSLLVDHAAMGCLSLVVEAADGLQPFVFVPFRFRSGRVALPARQLIFCRDIEQYLRLAPAIGRYLLRRGVPFLIHDGERRDPGLPGYFRAGMGPKYFRGPHRPRRGDIAYTERVIFGP